MNTISKRWFEWQIGDEFHYLKIIAGPINNTVNPKGVVFKCLCVCGKEKLIPRAKMCHYRSCGCKKGVLINASRSKPKNNPAIGDKINNLTIISEPIYKPNSKCNVKRWYTCKCICGKEVTKRIDVIHRINSSCGCVARKRCACTRQMRHGCTNTRLYRIFCGIKQRCYNTNCQHYKLYGGKGIKLYEDWFNDFIKFRDWASANGYEDKLVLDRINPDKNYCPDNCKWVTPTENSKNVFLFRKQERQDLLDKIIILKKEIDNLKNELTILRGEPAVTKAETILFRTINRP